MSRVSFRTDEDRKERGGRFYADRIVQRIGDRRITLYRRNDVADSSWFFCVYLREEQRQYRVSLRTSARDEARRKAESVLIELLGRVRNGEKILSPSLRDVLDC